jgi:tetratricopeptide (TPR) repeat protein
MNKLQKELGPKGLVVVGVTNESDSEVEKDVKKSKMKHPIVIVKGEDVDRAYGIKGYPAGFLVDPAGNVIWTGHPASLEDEYLAGLLKDLKVAPEVPAEFKDVNAALATRKYGKALTAINKALVKAPDSAELKAAQEFITSSLAGKLEEAAAALEAKDYGTANSLYGEIAAQYDGVAGAEAAKPALEALKKDKEAAPELAAQAKLAEAITNWRKGELEKALKAYQSIAKKWPDTESGKRAQELVDLH